MQSDNNLQPQAPETLRKLYWLKQNWRRHPHLILAGAIVVLVGIAGSAYGPQLVGRSKQPTDVRISAARPATILDGRVILSLNTSDPTKDTLEFGALAEWSSSPTGTFITSQGGKGPRYRAGEQYFIRLPGGQLWVITVREVLAADLILEFFKYEDPSAGKRTGA